MSEETAPSMYSTLADDPSLGGACHTANLRARFPEITEAKRTLMLRFTLLFQQLPHSSFPSFSLFGCCWRQLYPSFSQRWQNNAKSVHSCQISCLSSHITAYCHFGKLSVFELVMASRFFTLENARKKHVDITEPNIIRQYNQYMGGVDWWNLFLHTLNMAVVAAWKLHMELHTATTDQLSHLEFRREITIHLLHARPLDDVQFAKETAEMNVFSAKKGYTEIVFCPITV
ncbi:hypothetical protein T10_7970 [Trichinella papuae]|uniref:PiggyBac transposable element-derived protein domain-containing protein n=1 Tax=Trichinella papuae TaxID=268474 RepID=A0A0V1N697_9BILA|nr:hypothetical protein T10_7970 [Trichinella papuae]